MKHFILFTISKPKTNMKLFILFTITIFLISQITNAEEPYRPILRHKCNRNDKKVLFQIKESLGNPYDLTSWTKDTDCCQWYCVECDRNTSRINALRIFTANISGQIPDAVGDLPFLETIFFHHLTNLTGTIPISITKLTHLKSLTISNTNLSGPIPSFLSQIKTLTYLDLSFNDLSGSIPPSLSELQNLEYLRLDRNKLTGTIPDSFGHFAGKVSDLYLSHNQLTGSVPKSLGDINFSTIDLSRNQLVGDVSFLFGANKSLQSLYFSRNSIEFDLSKVEFPAGLTNLDFNHNKVFGSLPAGLIGLPLQFLNVSYNRLCGQIPQGGSLQRFTEFDYFHNRCLCGAPLPACK